MKGKAFSFADHDTFLFGRRDTCYCCLPEQQENGLMGPMRSLGQMATMFMRGGVG
jgi:hypothetical protein